jgi:1-deoxy-D-xylulose-5-phosphate synthase
MSLLDQINNPYDLRKLSKDLLGQVCKEVRDFTIKTVSETGGHLGASLGVVELTVALHFAFNTPKDRLVWDIGHQTYPHKILTERKDRMHTIRQTGGLSGFASIFESEYDTFGAGHSSTSISAALGMVGGLKTLGQNHNVVAVIGDSAISAGMAFEALNNASEVCKNFHGKFIVILNDNDMSIAPPTGAISKYLPKLYTSKPFVKIKNIAKNAAQIMGMEGIFNTTKRFVKEAISTAEHGNIFEELGFHYIGPIDGHDVGGIVDIFHNILHNFESDNRPIFLHIITKKGKGYAPAENALDKFHGVSAFDIESGQVKKSSKQTSYSHIFAKTLTEIAKTEPKIIAVTAAMPDGTGLNYFKNQTPERFYDVGIAEQHAVTFSAGLAKEGLKPFCALYSTFLQRAYDQLIHDVAIQNLPVRFAIDRAGLVGADGATHNGVFDAAFLRIIPNLVIISPSSGLELERAVKTAVNHDSGPIAFRYPRGGEGEFEFADINTLEAFEIGRFNWVCEGEKVAILCVGGMLKIGENVCEQIPNLGLIDARFIKPLDTQSLDKLTQNYEHLIIIEEGSAGGFGSSVLEYYANKSVHIPIKIFCLEDRFCEQDQVENTLKQHEITVEDVAQFIKKYGHGTH